MLLFFYGGMPMNILEAIELRHSVRRYLDKEIENDIVEVLIDYIIQCNHQSGLHVQLILNEPQAFSSKLATYGMFTNVNNYIAIVGKKDKDLEETVGYYGEKIVLKAQQLGLNTCWVALTYSKSKTKIVVNEDEKLYIVIALGYGESQGHPHKSKKFKQVVKGDHHPDWFIKGVEAALKAPTAVNQQNFIFSIEGNHVSVKPGLGFYSKIDLGIVKYHFEIGAGKQIIKWK